MIVPDLSLLIYAYRTSAPEHAKMRAWWEKTVAAGDVAIALPALFGFIRITTNRRVFQPPLPVEEAVGAVESWLAQPGVRTLLPGPRHLDIAFGLLRKLGAAANLTTDVQLAALAIEHQAELFSSDTDFGRFPGLRWTNPLT